jgi:hypothetical protein
MSVSMISVNTSDGMLTRATPQIPSNSRARSITITAKNIASVRRISISISPETILVLEYVGSLQVGVLNELQMETIRRRDGTYWTGWVWKMTDTSTWHQIPYRINTLDAVKAPDVLYAAIEHLRHIMNKELRIRPVVSDAVCVDVTELLRSTKEMKKTYKGVRTVISLHRNERV